MTILPITLAALVIYTCYGGQGAANGNAFAILDATKPNTKTTVFEELAGGLSVVVTLKVYPDLKDVSIEAALNGNTVSHVLARATVPVGTSPFTLSFMGASPGADYSVTCLKW